MRKALGTWCLDAANQDADFLVLVGDLGFGTFEDLAVSRPDQYINVGIMEGLLVDVAAGLASQGKHPLVYSIASFLTGRAFEHIRLSIAYNDNPVILVGAGGGSTYLRSGGTHIALEDFALMSLIPGMTVSAPSGPREMVDILEKVLKEGKPHYMRIGKYGEKDLPFQDRLVPGDPRLVVESSQEAPTLVISTGVVSGALAEFTSRVGELSRVITHIHVPFITPLRPQALNPFLQHVDSVLVVEDHYPTGGLYSQIIALLQAQRPATSNIGRVGPSADPWTIGVEGKVSNQSGRVAEVLRSNWFSALIS